VSHPPSRFRKDIQGLRGLAVLLVVVFHVGLLESGFVGVDIFFVISGFGVTGSLFRLLRSSGGTLGSTLGQFYRRRAARILPAFALVHVGAPCRLALPGRRLS
jgi:peptidoglycan/LPS O-acetylase OafA/YrhL